jgi:hypothetical protein
LEYITRLWCQPFTPAEDLIEDSRAPMAELMRDSGSLLDPEAASALSHPPLDMDCVPEIVGADNEGEGGHEL